MRDSASASWFDLQSWGGGATEPFQVRSHAEAPAGGFISRDKFVVLFVETASSLRMDFAENLIEGLTPSQALSALRCRRIKEPIGDVDLEVNLHMTSDGMQVEAVDTATGKRDRQTRIHSLHSRPIRLNRDSRVIWSWSRRANSLLRDSASASWFDLQSWGGGATEPFQVRSHAEAPAGGFISRDKFVVLFVETASSLRMDFAENLNNEFALLLHDQITLEDTGSISNLWDAGSGTADRFD